MAAILELLSGVLTHKDLKFLGYKDACYFLNYAAEKAKHLEKQNKEHQEKLKNLRR